jgi:heat shock protein beta
MKAQSFQNKDQISMMSGRKTLEVNPNHPVVIDLLTKVKSDKEDKAALDTAQVLFQTALIESGYEIADPSALVNRVYRLMSKELGVDPDAPLKEVEVPEGEEEEEEAEEEEKEEEDEDEKKRFSKLKDMYKPLTDWWKEKLTELTEKGAMKEAGVKVEKVEISKRLTESPVVVVTSQFGYSAQQEKVMKAQSFQNKDQISMMSGRKTLEVNPNHPVIVDLLSKVKGDKEDKAALDTAQVLFQTALIESGYEIADPSALVNRVYRLMSKELGVDPDAPLKEVEVPEGEEEEEEADEEAEEEETDDKDDSDDSEDKKEL